MLIRQREPLGEAPELRSHAPKGLIPRMPEEVRRQSLKGAMVEQAISMVALQRWGIALEATVPALEDRTERVFRDLLQGKAGLSTAPA